MATFATESRIGDWMGMLEQMGNLLTQLLAQTPEPAPVSEPRPNLLDGAPFAPLLAHHVDQIQESLDQAEASAMDADQQLAAAAAQLRAWLDRATLARLQLNGSFAEHVGSGQGEK